MKLLKLKYPKIEVFVIVAILAYLIFSDPKASSLFSNLGNLGYLGAFIGGLLFTFGFSSPLAAGFFIVLNPENIWLAGILGGLGALISDLFIFNFVRFSLMDEFKRMKRSKIVKGIDKLLKSNLTKKIRFYLMYTFAGFLIASPLPDEAGIMMLASLTKIKQSKLALISFLCNTIGILILLML